MEADLVYYQRRSAQEAAAAAASPSVKARGVHLELARHYEQRISALEAEYRRSALHIVSAA
jgi:hypothetical protein